MARVDGLPPSFMQGILHKLSLLWVPSSPFSPPAASQGQSRSPAEEVQPEIWIAQELRRIGDEFNASYGPRRVTFPSSLSTSLKGKG